MLDLCYRTFRGCSKMYEAVFALESLGRFLHFEEAFKALYYKIESESNLSLQVLETATWIKEESSELPIMFYDARDLACKLGLLKYGKLVEES